MAIYTKNGRLVVEFGLRGQRVFRRLPAGSKKKEAQELETRLRASIFGQVDLGKRPGVSLQTAIYTWLNEVVRGRKAERQTRNHARALAPFIEGQEISSIHDVAAKIKTAPKLAIATRNRRICILKAVAKFAFQRDWTSENLSAKIQVIPGEVAREVYLTKPQLAHLLSHCECEATRAWITIAAWTGLRQSEIMRLTQDDIQMDVLLVRVSKTDEPRRVPILPAVRAGLGAIPFTLHARTYYARFMQARDSAGMPWLHFHDLRHTFGSWLGAEGTDALMIARLMGHKNLATTKRYVHFDDDAMIKAARKIA